MNGAILHHPHYSQLPNNDLTASFIKDHLGMDGLNDDTHHAAVSNNPFEIIPLKSYVIKTFLSQPNLTYPYGTKLFVNMTHSPYVPSPPVATDDDILHTIKYTNSDNLPKWRVPMSLSSLRDDFDKSGKPCIVIDALINTDVIGKCSKIPDLEPFLIELALSFVEDKHKLALSREYTLPKMQCKGDPATHKIYRPKQPGIIDTYSSRLIKQSPLYNVRKFQSKYEVSIQLPLLHSIDRLSVEIEDASIILDHDLYFTHIRLNQRVDIDSDLCCAKFDYCTSNLSVSLPFKTSL